MSPLPEAVPFRKAHLLTKQQCQTVLDVHGIGMDLDEEGSSDFSDDQEDSDLNNSASGADLEETNPSDGDIDLFLDIHDFFFVSATVSKAASKERGTRSR
eukprot:NODE_827_length_1165_cov_70.111753_g785_i0.p1 GENE.NODE_827_length_1165_cov_70.111753_g785_i0~~NODE_827_length_1165_cov_70.111753_g785_i0.p1  ORF type:complete len:100 (+),score=13.40 NODE_827_length_1165_cov_70.111753_g785_i0:590-889(+)